MQDAPLKNERKRAGCPREGIVYRIAIIDDIAAERANLEAFLRRFSSERKLTLEISAYADGESFLAEAASGFDVVLLDIEMQGIDGMETARRLRALDEKVCLLFVTHLAQFAVEGYSVHALDFLVKTTARDGCRTPRTDAPFLDEAGLQALRSTASPWCARASLPCAESTDGRTPNGFRRCSYRSHGYRPRSNGSTAVRFRGRRCCPRSAA